MKVPQRGFVLALLIAMISALLLAACAGDPGKPGKPGKAGLPGLPGKPGLQGAAGGAGAAGGGQPQANLAASGQTMYLDAPFTIRGSGFRAYEPVSVYINAGGTGAPVLGATDADAGGAFSLDLGAGTVTVAEGVMTLQADGEDGTKASIPIAVAASSPAAQAAPGASVVLSTNSVPEGGAFQVWGAGFGANEVLLITAIVFQSDLVSTQPLTLGGVAATVGGAFALDVSAPTGGWGIDFNPMPAGVTYTIEVTGGNGSRASAPLAVTAP